MSGPRPEHIEDITALTLLLADKRACVLTGAGVSTDSGIPDYRGPETRKKLRRPMRAKQFLGSEALRQRYWARSYIGFSRVASASPNGVHYAVAALERRGRAVGVVTQNVDGLHQKAGAQNVVCVHGDLSRVVCLSCRAQSSRHALQAALAQRNPGAQTRADTLAPDGDADLDATADFVVIDCAHCGGVLKPDVVFFGESVRPEDKAGADALLDHSTALLVLGTSLEVYSARRLVMAAHRRGLPIAIVNQGPTRGDELATIKIDAPLLHILPHVV